MCKSQLRRVVQILLEENGWQSTNCLLVKIYVMYIFNLVSLEDILLYLLLLVFFHSLDLKLYK